MGLFDKWTKGEKPDYGLLDDFISKSPPEYYNPETSYKNVSSLDPAMIKDKYNPDDIRWNHRGIYEFDTDDGKRFYFGEGDTDQFDRNLSQKEAYLDAAYRFEQLPGDSLKTEDREKFEKYGLYEDYDYKKDGFLRELDYDLYE